MKDGKKLEDRTELSQMNVYDIKGQSSWVWCAS